MGVEVMVRGDVHLYVATAGTAKPSLDGTLDSGVWKEFGNSYFDGDGITVSGNQTVEEEEINNSVYGQEAFRTRAELMVSGQVKDFSLEAVAQAMNQNTIAETAATATASGFKSMPLKLGTTVKKVAILVRGSAPYGNADDNDDWNLQVWIPRAYEAGNFTTVLGKGAASLVPVEFRALEHATLGVGAIDAKNADATG